MIEGEMEFVRNSDRRKTTMVEFNNNSLATGIKRLREVYSGHALCICYIEFMQCLHK